MCELDSTPELSMDLKLKQIMLAVETSCSGCTDIWYSVRIHANKHRSGPSIFLSRS